MSSPKFELAKQSNPGLADLLDRMMAYIEHQRLNGEEFFLPKLAAAFLDLNDGEAYVLLELLASAGVLKRIYNVYCVPKGQLLATVDSEDELDDVPYCDFCDCQHEEHELRLEVVFEMDDSGHFRKAA